MRLHFYYSLGTTKKFGSSCFSISFQQVYGVANALCKEPLYSTCMSLSWSVCGFGLFSLEDEVEVTEARGQEWHYYEFEMQPDFCTISS